MRGRKKRIVHSEEVLKDNVSIDVALITNLLSHGKRTAVAELYTLMVMYHNATGDRDMKKVPMSMSRRRNIAPRLITEGYMTADWKLISQYNIKEGKDLENYGKVKVRIKHIESPKHFKGFLITLAEQVLLQRKERYLRATNAIGHNQTPIKSENGRHIGTVYNKAIGEFLGVNAECVTTWRRYVKEFGMGRYNHILTRTVPTENGEALTEIIRETSPLTKELVKLALGRRRGGRPLLVEGLGTRKKKLKYSSRAIFTTLVVAVPFLDIVY